MVLKGNGPTHFEGTASRSRGGFSQAELRGRKRAADLNYPVTTMLCTPRNTEASVTDASAMVLW